MEGNSQRAGGWKLQGGISLAPKLTMVCHSMQTNEVTEEQVYLLLQIKC